MSAPVKGVDISSWQHADGAAIDWEAVAASGVRFAIVKATQGTSYVNPHLLKDLSDARAAGLLVGAYHYFEAKVDAAAQGQWATSQLIGEVLDLGLWLDWECYAPAEFVHNQEVVGFLEAAKAARPGCGLYCDQSWWEVLKGTDALPGRLWLAAASVPEGCRPTIVQSPSPGTCPGITGSVDTDQLVSTRGVDLPGAPKARPTDADAKALADLAKAEADEADAELEDKAAAAELEPEPAA